MKFYITKHFIINSTKLAKKFPNLKNDLISALNNFKNINANSIGRSIYKIRIRSSDLNKGKSGGLRCYIYLMTKNDTLVPLCIYFKSEQDSISPSELEKHFDITINELHNRFGNIL